MGSTPLVSKSLTSSLSEFLSCWAGSDILGCRPCWCLSPFPSPYNLGVFPFTLHMPLDFIHVSSLWPTYLHPFGLPFTYSQFKRVAGLGPGSGTRCCGPRGGTECNRNLDPNFCLDRGRTSNTDATEFSDP